MGAMEDAMRQREATVQRAMEEMHYYKLELQNREENYNQLFGAKAVHKAGSGLPQRESTAAHGGGGGGMPGGASLRVGVINPLQNKNDAARAPVNGARKTSTNSANAGAGGPLPKLAGPTAAWGAAAPSPAAEPASHVKRGGSGGGVSLPFGVPGTPSQPLGGAPAPAPAPAGGLPTGGLPPNPTSNGNNGLPSGLLAPADEAALGSARGGGGLGSGRRPSSGSIAGSSPRSQQLPGSGRGGTGGLASDARPSSSGATVPRKWASSA